MYPGVREVAQSFKFGRELVDWMYEAYSKGYPPPTDQIMPQLKQWVMTSGFVERSAPQSLLEDLLEYPRRVANIFSAGFGVYSRPFELAYVMSKPAFWRK